MKTIQEVIRGMKPEEIAREYCFDYPVEIGGLEKVPEDITVGGLKERREKRLSEFIRLLADMEPEPSDEKVRILFLTKADVEDTSKRGLCLAYAEEILAATSYDYEDFSCYDISFTPREKAVSFLVADNKYTQDHLSTVVIEFVHELITFGMNYADVQEVIDDLEESFEQSRNCTEWLSREEMRKKLGLPEEEIYPQEKELHHRLLEARVEYAQYCRAMELERIRESLRKMSPTEGE
ncbi:MAG: hypothetical protein IJ733_02325 [Lachnospiraceae bacterium]|nr:hypothetical protein [Lachnospiraceae bacterium]